MRDRLPWLSPRPTPTIQRKFAWELFHDGTVGTCPLVEQALNRHPQEDWNPVENAAGAGRATPSTRSLILDAVKVVGSAQSL
jgi:hypothetical protein